MLRAKEKADYEMNTLVTALISVTKYFTKATQEKVYFISQFESTIHHGWGVRRMKWLVTAVDAEWPPKSSVFQYLDYLRRIWRLASLEELCH